ncbi:MAG: hypothetical protein [Olavius algarvensis spirochete endosymbiont]|nr:MAG: hypothetical protein [Olavius algarvensis spirochete endosymbiont]
MVVHKPRSKESIRMHRISIRKTKPRIEHIASICPVKREFAEAKNK